MKNTERVKMEKLVFGGQCLGHLDNKVVFAWNALPGEEVEVEFEKNKKTFAEGTAVSILNPSPDRVAPKEDHYLICSPWQILSWDAENRWKKEIAKETLIKIGGLPDNFDLELLRGDYPYNYRNKMEFSFAPVEGKMSLAFFERGKRIHLPIDGCELAETAINDAAKYVLEWVNKEKIPLRSLKSLIVRSNNQNQAIAGLFIKDRLKLGELPALNDKLKGFSVFYSSHLCPASRVDDTLYHAGEDHLVVNLRGSKLKFGLQSFFQINIPVFEKALEDIAGFLTADKSGVDYYSGVGAIGLALASKFKDLILVESNTEAGEYAKENIILNNLEEKCRAEVRPAEKMTELITWDKIIIVDPPRSGLHDKVTDRIMAVQPERIIYLSCNVATQARDIKILSPHYAVKFLKLYNFFPRTPHIESLCVLDRL